mmetsp:Transcript_23773/g.20686  ORF Transcript_23773/g.20686 Transcript_23773/m.20686 type:complete len:90 (-) Transcript_23773:184-453(-)
MHLKKRTRLVSPRKPLDDELNSDRPMLRNQDQPDSINMDNGYTIKIDRVDDSGNRNINLDSNIANSNIMKKRMMSSRLDMESFTGLDRP